MEGHTGPTAHLPMDPTRSAARHQSLQAWFRIADVVLAIGIVIAAVGHLLAPLPPAPAPESALERIGGTTTSAFLGEGAFDVILPLFTLYAPAFESENGSTYVEVQFTSTHAVSGNVTFTWNVSPTLATDLRFVPPPFSEGPLNSFRIYPAGWCDPGCISQTYSHGWFLQGVNALLVSEGHVNYTTWRVTYQDAVRTRSWVELRYAFSSMITTGYRMPYAGVTDPSPSDLVPLGVRSSWIDPGQQERYYISSFSPLPVSVFHWTPPEVTIALGPLGNVSAHLSSTFAWGGAVDHWMRIENHGGVAFNATLEFYLDRRFGSLFAVQIP